MRIQARHTVSVYLREEYGQHERALRPSCDSAPNFHAHLTEPEVRTLKRRISAYLQECYERRSREDEHLSRESI